MRDSNRESIGRHDDGAHALDADRDPGHPGHGTVTPDRKEVVARERAEHGGWELDRLRLSPDGTRRVVLRRKIIRQRPTVYFGTLA